MSTIEKLPEILDALLDSYADGVGVNRAEGHDLPNTRVVRTALERLFDIIFPGFSYSGHPVTESNLAYHIGDQLNHVFLELAKEVERAFRYECEQRHCSDCQVVELSRAAVNGLLASLPSLREVIKTDVQAGFAGDPASASLDEVIISYPAVRAIVIHRLAHEMHLRKVPLIPRMWSEYAHSITGIDIHPGASIGGSFFIDHGTGVVIGETCVIGNHVQLYQGVTLGALAPAKGQKIRGVKRHPTIEDNVVIYAGATILGGETVVGHDATIGGNVWITSSVEPYTKVVLPKADLLFLQPGQGRKMTPADFRCPAKALCEADGTRARSR